MPGKVQKPLSKCFQAALQGSNRAKGLSVQPEILNLFIDWHFQILNSICKGGWPPLQNTDQGKSKEIILKIPRYFLKM